MSLNSFRDLVGVAYTEEEANAIAAEIEAVDGPNYEGEMYTRPGKISDRFPQPYPNEQAARLLMEEHILQILVSSQRFEMYCIIIPTFPGGAIAMPKMINDGAIEYEDGTPATESQMGKDVVMFLLWAAEPELEERKLMGFKWIFMLSLALLQAVYYRRLKWSVLKSRKLVLDVVN